MDSIEPTPPAGWEPLGAAQADFCAQCGAPVDDGAVVCGHCGERLVDPELLDADDVPRASSRQAPRVIGTLVGIAVAIGLLAAAAIAAVWPLLARVFREP